MYIPLPRLYQPTVWKVCEGHFFDGRYLKQLYHLDLHLKG